MRDSTAQPGDRWVRLLPWAVALVTLLAVAPFSVLGIWFLVPWLLPSFAVLFALSLRARARLAQRQPRISNALVSGGYGACLGALLTVVGMHVSIQNDRSSTAAIGYLALPVLIPAGTLFFGLFAWAVARLVARPKDQATPSAQIRSSWIPGLVVAGLTGLAVARATPEGTLRELAKSPSARIRAAVAQNAHAPGDLLRTLSDDPDPQVHRLAREAARHAGVSWQPPAPLREAAEPR
jgi:hypothetical protein